MAKDNFEVIVGNIGTVHAGNNIVSADCKYKTYVKSSQSPYGRASGETVTLLKNGEIVKEYIGVVDQQD